MGLSDDQLEYQRIALQFANKELAPRMIERDETEHFPVDVLRRAASLGFGGIYVRPDVGGSELTRMDSSVYFRNCLTQYQRLT